MSFRSVFIAIVVGFALIVAAFLINRRRPSVETEHCALGALASACKRRNRSRPLTSGRGIYFALVAGVAGVVGVLVAGVVEAAGAA
jgi:hypothetical protein